MTKSLSEFAITPRDGQYVLRLTDEDGTETELAVSFEQLDLLSEEIDRRLDEDEN